MNKIIPPDDLLLLRIERQELLRAGSVGSRLGKGLGKEDVWMHILGKLSGLESQLRAGDHELAEKSIFGTSLVVQWLGICQCRGCGFDPWSKN